jgi:hypothetical protein
VKRYLLATLALGVLLCGTLSVSAQQRPGERPRPAPGAMIERMQSLDENGDGQLERSELPPGMADRFLTRGDTDGDGKISESELRQMFPGTSRPQSGRPTTRPAAPATEEAEEKPPFEVGKPAPDVELKLLAQIEDPDGKRSYEITDETVQVSSHEGEQVVCLFLSSYT